MGKIKLFLGTGCLMILASCSSQRIAAGDGMQTTTAATNKSTNNTSNVSERQISEGRSIKSSNPTEGLRTTAQ